MPPLSSAATCPLGPVTNVTPLELKDIISGYGRRSLGAARIGEDYSQPPPGISGAFASLADNHTKFAYRFVVLGEISGQPEFCRGWPGRALLSLVCPNWFTSGWPHDLFEDEFNNQLLAMRYISVLDCQQDEIAGKKPKLGKWANDRSLKLEIRPTFDTEYILPNGHYNATSPSTKDFPLLAGDTILAECTLYRFEFEHCTERHWRGYSLVVNRVQRLEIADCNDEASPRYKKAGSKALAFSKHRVDFEATRDCSVDGGSLFTYKTIGPPSTAESGPSATHRGKLECYETVLFGEVVMASFEASFFHLSPLDTGEAKIILRRPTTASCAAREVYDEQLKALENVVKDEEIEGSVRTWFDCAELYAALGEKLQGCFEVYTYPTTGADVAWLGNILVPGKCVAMTAGLQRIDYLDKASDGPGKKVFSVVLDDVIDLLEEDIPRMGLDYVCDKDVQPCLYCAM
ncbi:hypothetical protein C8R43DRAFT_955699 [Mycena crocata]|nr:hypothetical protein C8R43DRAFT_955699 [Mycena crocata]